MVDLPIDAAGRSEKDRQIPRTLACSKGIDALCAERIGEVHRRRHPLQEHGSPVPRRTAEPVSRARANRTRREDRALPTHAAIRLHQTGSGLQGGRENRPSARHRIARPEPAAIAAGECHEAESSFHPDTGSGVSPSPWAISLALDLGRCTDRAAADLARFPAARRILAATAHGGQRGTGRWAAMANGQPREPFHADALCEPGMPVLPGVFPQIKRWVGSNADVALQWHHLPLAAYEPAASIEARLAECATEAGGHAAFWQVVEWVYTHTRSDGEGLPDGLLYPESMSAIEQCMASNRADVAIRTQAAEATKSGVTATPSLRVLDRQTGQAILL